MSPPNVIQMSALKNLSVIIGVFVAVFILSAVVSAKNDLELSSRVESDPESMDEIQEMLQNVQILYEMKIASKVREGVEREEEAEEEEGQTDVATDQNGCKCKGFRCSCRQRIYVPKLNLNHQSCLSLTYVRNKNAMVVSLQIGWRWIIYSKQLSATNPPVVCINVPYLRQGGSVCIQFYNMKVTGRWLRGCAKFIARYCGVTVANINLSCFNMHCVDTTRQVGAVELPWLDGMQASVQEPEPLYFGKVPMEKIKPSGL